MIILYPIFNTYTDFELHLLNIEFVIYYFYLLFFGFWSCQEFKSKIFTNFTILIEVFLQLFNFAI